jgi:hypothetical protein
MARIWCATHLLKLSEFLPEHTPSSRSILRLELCAIHENSGETGRFCEGAESALEVSGVLARLSKGDLTLRRANEGERSRASNSALHLLFRLLFYLCDRQVIHLNRRSVVWVYVGTMSKDARMATRVC